MPPQDTDAIAAEVNDLLSDEAARRNMGRNAYLHARQMVWQQVGRSYENLIRKVVAGSREAAVIGFSTVE